MDPLLNKRRTIKGQTTRIEAVQIGHATTPLNDAAIPVYQNKVDKLTKELDTIHNSISAICLPADFDVHETEYNQISTRLEDLTIFFADLLLHRTASSRSAASSAAIGDIKLPKLEIPTFSGKYTEWVPFHDLYTATVHGNLKLSASQKFHYLKQALRNEAATLILSIPVTDANYSVAWDILLNRYNNEREIIDAHVKRLFNQPSMTNESAAMLRRLIDTTVECVRSLTVLKQPTDSWDAILLHIVKGKLDQESRRQWELSLSGTKLPKFEELKTFLETRARALAAAQSSTVVGRQKVPTEGSRKTAVSHYGTAREKCIICCKEGHAIYRCSTFLKASNEERWTLVKKHLLCFNCLRADHQAGDCRAGACRKCSSKHNSLLHREQSEQNEQSEQRDQSEKKVQSDQEVVSHIARKSSGKSNVLLSTAIIQVRDATGNYQRARALLDTASQTSFISEACAQRLQLKRSRLDISIGGIGDKGIDSCQSSVKLKLRSDADSNIEVTVEALILKRVTGYLPQIPCDPTKWPHIKGLKLADPKFHVPGQVDILLGADICIDIMDGGVLKGPPNTPGAFSTIFGWAISGPQTLRDHESSDIHVHHCTIDVQLKKFWELEEIAPQNILTSSEALCESIFRESHTRDANGRYMVRLPFKINPDVLGDSRKAAVRRFYCLERQLEKDQLKQAKYQTFMTEYLELGHMELIPSDENRSQQGSNYYLPHHCVSSETSSTTSLRTVFDGSAKSSTGISLNDTLLVGPKLQEDLINQLIRFRLHSIVMVADLAKMFRQILVHPEDTDFQRIIWRPNNQVTINDYRLLTVTYGTASAPYLAVKVLKQLSQDEKNNFPLASSVLSNDFYVDNLMSGRETVKEALQLQTELMELTRKGGFELRKWASNEPKILESIPPELREIQGPLRIDTDEAIKTLGLYWQPAADQFIFLVKLSDERRTVTKRIILSDTAKIFDPLGLLAPIVVVGKILLQQLWSCKLEWDEPLSSKSENKWMLDKWTSYRKELPEIQSFAIQRHISQSCVQEYSLHGFCDASEQAYAAAVYLKSIDINGKAQVQLIAAKTRVAPLKTESIPRLELCGAVLLTRLIKLVQDSLKMPVQKIHGWTDSMIVLAWLASPPQRWKTFVANRVSEIHQTLTPIGWDHVPGESNPCDCASRGISVSTLCNLDLWWKGPQWLAQGSRPIRHSIEKEPEECLLEEKRIKHLAAYCNLDCSLLESHSSLRTLLHVTAYTIRFIKNLRKAVENKKNPNTTVEKESGTLSKQELDFALTHWIKAVQMGKYLSEIKRLQENKQVKGKSTIQSLNPFLDQEGILRVGGRLRHALIPATQTNPIILPKKSHLTDIIIKHEHEKNFHGGSQLLMAILQKRYWIVGLRDAIRFHIRKCVRCVRQQASTVKQIMGDLPSPRVNPSRAFLKCGVDYAGPFLLRVMKGRGHKMFKAYISVFVCFSTRALHLELVSDMTTEAFLAALKRFVSRRGKPAEMYSDCGTNFIGANREMKDFLKFMATTTNNEHLTRWCADEGINWHFNPPAAPHFGGLWEAGVKSVKFHLKRVVGSTNLTFEEMQTLLCQIEACLNSRPLTPLSTDPTSFAALTPGHFLIGDAISAIPEPDFTATQTNRLSKWQVGQQILQHFWRRWRNEYLARLQQRPKWATITPNLKVGDLVIIKDSDLPPTKWKMGRILKLHPGADGCVRVVTLKTADKELQRPISKLCQLPLD